jgi:riboflavin-specific deaminase-like protein
VELDEWLAESLQRTVSSNLPSVTLSYAQSLDGSLALRKGEPMVLSGPESHKLTHQLRAAHDAILVGIGTVLSDDPQLNVRLVEGKNPRIVVLDSQLRTPRKAQLLKSKPIIFCAESAKAKAQKELEEAGAVIERQRDKTATRVDLPAMLARLWKLGVRTVMVEGGGEIIVSFLSEKIVDRVIITIAPQFVGGYRAVESAIGEILELVNEGSEKFGKDLVIWGDMKHETH